MQGYRQHSECPRRRRQSTSTRWRGSTSLEATFSAPSITVQLGDTVLIGHEVFACVYKPGGLFDNGRGVACAYLPKGAGTTVAPTTQGIYVSDHVAVVATPGYGRPIALVIKRHYH